MTTKPKAKKYRIRRNKLNSLTGDTAPDDQVETADDAAPTATEDTADPVTLANPKLEAIRQEGLTARQLRMARRVAQKNGLSPASDLEAVMLLRDRGIDPFKRSSTLALVKSNTAAPESSVNLEPGESDALADVHLPQTVPSFDRTAPALSPAAERAREIQQIQRDITRRRQRKLAMLFVRLFFFVAIPTAAAGYYFFAVATPMYATMSEFRIEQSDSPSSVGASSLLGSTPMATVQDSVSVQGYLQSREAMLRLDESLAFKDHFSDPSLDLLQRLSPDASNEDAYKLYRRYVKIGYDPTEGIVRMEVSAANPEISAQYARRLVEFAEERVDQITQRVREDSMKGARASYEEAELNREEALTRMTQLQEELGVIDAAAATSELQARITSLQQLSLEKELELASLLDNRRPNEARVDALRGEVRRIEAKIAEVRGLMTSTGGDNANQARKNAELRAAEEDYQTRTLLLQQSLQQMEMARIEAERQVRYLSVSVSPIPPDEPTYPRAFENTLLAFLIFLGIYLMISLTASILREQVSS
ncbi:capsule biosynthesis protein [Pseudaestuariivita rosea]|uniref:capsule biosynthesis protein n=1 Tax=Pseudaestuariivita rosea TaxID=2763263 RepID=UPI001ABA6D65|nr:capsule biosynthesis protein [Pseudaestuariivita rosea]